MLNKMDKSIMHRLYSTKAHGLNLAHGLNRGLLLINPY